MLVVSDTSVLIDLERASLLMPSFRLRFGFAVPDLLYERELKSFGGEDLRKCGLRVEALDSAGVALAIQCRRSRPGLSLPDTFALALAKSHGWTLLTGDSELRQVAEHEHVTCHGVLWLLDPSGTAVSRLRERTLLAEPPQFVSRHASLESAACNSAGNFPDRAIMERW